MQDLRMVVTAEQNRTQLLVKKNQQKIRSQQAVSVSDVGDCTYFGTAEN